MTLWMRDQENIEKGIEKGKIYGMLDAYREIGMTDDIISKKLQEKFHLSENEAEEYLLETN